MKIKFEDNLDYQLEAIDSVVDIFTGQESNNTVFTVEKPVNNQLRLGKVENELGIGNSLILLPEEIKENLNKVQTKNGVSKTKILSEDNYNFSVEMETGTGKTYVYLRTIMELNRRYDFTKFIIVVPSIAIKEGVYKTLQITEKHFKELYDNIPYDYFIYDSKKIDMIRNFAVNDTIQIMIITIDAFNKDSNVIKQERDQANGYRPIEYIQKCNPIVIMDEPQNMETAKAKEAINSLNPLCTLRYSATHKDKYNSLYKLDSVDACERQLVKQIEVATVETTENHNLPYIKVTNIKATKSGINAKIELDVKQKKGVKRKEISIKHGDDLKEKAKRDIYEGYIVNEITYKKEDPSKSYINLGKTTLTLGQVNGGENPDVIKRLQIRKTIEEHFDKQLRLRSKGIKVLSLFFIDRVANYRTYDPETGEAQKGKYALMFEEEYNKLLEQPRYNEMGDQSVPFFKRAGLAHDGYFSADKKKSKSGKEYYEEKDTKGTTLADEDTFNKIMRDKEKLLSFDEPLSFIFSHSALKEGWDNPNVFQICTLNETTSTMKKRQEVGRGLRIAVNQDGERVRGFDVNTLTVMANESYEDFVKNLQKEMEEDENIKFGFIENFIFSNIITETKNGKEIYLGHEKSEELYNYLVQEEYIDEGNKPGEGIATKRLKVDIENNLLKLPEEFENLRLSVVRKLKLSMGKLAINNADNKKVIKYNKKVALGDDFKELWNKIKYKTIYQVDFDGEELKDACIKNIDEGVYIPEQKFIFNKKRLAITKGGIIEEEEYSVSEEGRINIEYRHMLPDIVTYLQNETNLTRKSIVDILTKIKTLNSFKKDPQLFLEQVSDIIKRTMKYFIVKGIKYEKIGDNEYYSQELFNEEELIGYLKTAKNPDGNLVESSKSPYTGSIVDSDIERNFAIKLEENKNVIVYSKLPNWFTIPTPLGSYNPDWAILVRPDLSKSEEKLYFVIETKGTLDPKGRTEKENKKIECGRKHFEALSNEKDKINYKVVSKYENFKDFFIK